MIRWNLKRIFAAKGIVKPNKFLIQNGHSASYASHLMTENINSISLVKLEMLCISLNCTPNDLFDYVPTKDVVLPENHALKGLIKTDVIEEMTKMMQNMPMEKVEEMWAILKEKEVGNG